MDCTTLTKARNELTDRLTELGRALDRATDPDEMRALITQRKRDQAALAVLAERSPLPSH
jgi:hypothetical protein